MKLSGIKSKLRRKRRHGYMHFKGSKEYFIRNGAKLLQESISTFYGRWNPIYHFSIRDLNNMNVETVPFDALGFYNLYKGSWEGSVVLVKKEKAPGGNNTMFLREIMVEAQLATHNNVHKLLGCCLETEFPVLVYDGMVDVTLRDRLERDENDQNKQVRVLEWKDRLRIAWEICHVIVYLHTAFHRPIIHRGLKTCNVFLDHDNRAKLSDFGLAILIPEGEQVVETDIIGTWGCMAPEYVLQFQVAESTDVYSFGMLFLEILTGKDMAAMLIEIFTWVRNGLRKSTIKKIMDPVITRKATTAIMDSQLIASIKLARRCISLNQDHRPTIMEVATQLKKLMAAQEIPDSVPPQANMERLTHKIYSGSKENRERNEELLLKESICLLDGGVKPIHYFSINDLNNMNVEHDLITWDDDWLCYQGSWEGKAVFVKHPHGFMDLKISNRMHLRLLREILIATEMAACNSVQKLLGCCLETKFPILVYDWVAPHELNDRILSSYTLPVLEWKDRLRIAWEISIVVSYLHTWFSRPIIYNDIEPMFVFVDKYNTAKLSSFSHSVSIPEGEEFMVLEDFEILHTIKDHYKPPEYKKHRKVGKCTNVYSFGVLFLALLTGKSVYYYDYQYWKAYYMLMMSTPEKEQEKEESDMIECVKNAIKDDCVIGILDPAIISNGLTDVEGLQLQASVQLAIKCVEGDHGNRPTMVEVTTELSNIIRFTDLFDKV